MNYKIVKELLKSYPQIREVVDLANDYNVECEECARIFVALVDSVVKGDGLKEIIFKEHYIDGMSFVDISLKEGVGSATAHRWVEEYELRIASALSFVRGFDIWIDHHFPELRPYVV